MSRKERLLLTRRELLRLLALGGAGAYLSACGPRATPVAPTATAGMPQPSPTATLIPTPAVMVNSAGKEMPADVAPLDQQLFREMTEQFGTHIEWIKTVYNRAPGGRRCQIALARLNNDFEIVPEAAESWEVSEDGLTWTFRIRKGLKWSDGVPLNAQDFVWTLQRAANPATAYDGGFMFSLVAGIKNWRKVEAGELPLDELGVEAPDDYTLRITTESPKPFFVQPMKEAVCSPRHMFEKYGEDWATDLKTMVFSGPYQTTEWVHRDHVTQTPNPEYNGPLKPYLEQYRVIYGLPENKFPAYLTNEVDIVESLTVAELKQVLGDEDLISHLHSYPHWQNWYITLDTFNPPFNDLKVRQAMSHAIDVDTVCNTTLKDVATPNRSMLMPGYPGYNEELQKVQKYDPQLAKELMAEAGYPGGQGFPKVEMWARDLVGERPMATALGEFIQAQLKDNLGIEVGFRMVEAKSFAEALNKHTHNFFLVPYEYDYVDPSNLLDLWLPGSRHAWENEKYTELVTKADAMMADPEERLAMYQDAERILVEDVGAIFLLTPVRNALWRPYLKGKAVSPNKDGIARWNHDITTTAYELYVAKL